MLSISTDYGVLLHLTLCRTVSSTTGVGISVSDPTVDPEYNELKERLLHVGKNVEKFKKSYTKVRTVNYLIVFWLGSVSQAALDLCYTCSARVYFFPEVEEGTKRAVRT